MTASIGEHRTSDWQVLSRYLRRRRGPVAVLGLLLLASAALAVVSPQFLRHFIDQALDRAAIGVLLQAAVFFIGFAALAQGLSVVADLLAARVAWSATNELRADLLAHCLRMDLSFFQDHSGGELVERIDGDVGKLANFFSRLFLVIVSNLLLLVGIGVALVAVDWRIGLCYFPLVAGSLLLLRKLVGAAIPAAEEQRAAVSRIAGYLAERLGGLEDVRPNGAVSAVAHGFWLRAGELLGATRRAAVLGVRWPATAQGLASVGLVLALTAGAGLYLTDQVTLGGAYLFVAYAAMLQVPFILIVTQVQDLQGALGAMSRIRLLLDTQSTIRDGSGRLPGRSPGTGIRLELDAISYWYRAGEFALRDVSLELSPGQRLAVIGRTGAGKSTLARLLLRFTDPCEGRIRFDGNDLRDATVDSVRAQVGMVNQEVQLFQGTVRDNLTLFDPDVPDPVLRRILDEVGLAEWLAGLPEGLDTTLGAGETGLSAGEAQLLAFARVLLGDPGLVVLDEASSRLDAASRRRYEQAVERLLAGRTAVIIAHQEEAVRAADRVLLLEGGRVAEEGDRLALAADPDSGYSRFWLRMGQLEEAS